MNQRVGSENIQWLAELRRRFRPLAYLVAAGVVALSVPAPAARAAIIGTEAVVDTARGAQERARVLALLQRAEVRQQLLHAGVDPAAVEDRVAALSDAEVAKLAGQLDRLPAGGDALGVLVFVFVVLLITDILGFTDVFPFVKKPVRR